MAERILSFPDALAEVLAAADSVGRSIRAKAPPERVPLLASLDRILAEPVRAERDQPPFPRSTRDGFAVRSADLAPGTPLRVIGLLRAGGRWDGPALGPGEALEIMTGAPAPDGADAVLMIEHTETAQNSAAGHIQPRSGRTLQPGENIVPRGAEALAGAELVPAGRLIGAPEIALAASCGYAELAVFPRPRVAILATGDELVELTETPEPQQIRNSNSYALAALVALDGGEPQRLPVARDAREDLRARLGAARGADLLLLSGGVSMGKYDLVEDALREAGAELLFTGTLIQPGKPLVFGRLPHPSGSTGHLTYFFGLPGNPVATEVCFRLFVAPLLRALTGGKELAPRFAEARLCENVRGGAGVTRFLPAEIAGDWKGVTVRPIPWQGSGDLAANGRADGFLVLPAGVPQFTAGETVRVLLR